MMDIVITLLIVWVFAIHWFNQISLREMKERIEKLEKDQA